MAELAPIDLFPDPERPPGLATPVTICLVWPLLLQFAEAGESAELTVGLAFPYVQEGQQLSVHL